MPFSEKFDESQLRSYSKMNDVTLSPSVTNETSIPFRWGSHGFIAMQPLVNASYAASLVTSAPHRLHGQDDHYFSPYLSSAGRYLRTLMRDDRPPAYSVSRSSSENYNLGQEESAALSNRPEGNGRFGGQGKKKGRLMSVSEGVGAEVYLEPSSGMPFFQSSDEAHFASNDHKTSVQ